MDSLTHDFPGGTAWGQPLTSPTASQVTMNVNMGGIQGGLQQGGSGAVQHQLVFINALTKLVQQVEAIQASPEVAALSESARTDINEVAEDLKEEASSPAPDRARVRKFGERFLARLRSAGLMVAGEALRVALFAALTAKDAL